MTSRKPNRWIFTTDLWVSPNLRWKSNFSLSKAVPVCVLKKQEPQKHGFRVIYTHRWIFTTDLWFCPNFKVKIWLFTVKSCSWGKIITYLLNLWPSLLQIKLLKKHVLAVHDFKKTKQIDYHYRLLVQFKSKVKI